MGNACTKAEDPVARKNRFLVVARYSLPAYILIQANKVTKERIDEFTHVFNKLGKKKLMEVSKVGEALTALGYKYTEEELKVLFKNADVEGDDRIDLDYFVKVVLGFIRRTDAILEMKQAFSVFDTDGDGLIDSSEVRHCMKWNDQLIAKFIREADRNGDGMIDYNEFVRLLVECDDEEDFN